MICATIFFKSALQITGKTKNHFKEDKFWASFNLNGSYVLLMEHNPTLEHAIPKVEPRVAYTSTNDTCFVNLLFAQSVICITS